MVSTDGEGFGDDGIANGGVPFEMKTSADVNRTPRSRQDQPSHSRALPGARSRSPLAQRGVQPMCWEHQTRQSAG